MLVLLLSNMFTSELSKGIIRPLGKLSLRRPRRGSTCSRMRPLLDGVNERDQRVHLRLRTTEERRGRFSVVARGVRRKLLIVSHCAVMLSIGSDIKGLLGMGRVGAKRDMCLLGHSRRFQNIIKRILRKGRRGGVLYLSNDRVRIVTGPIAERGGARNTIVLLISIARGMRERRLQERFSTGISRRLGAPLASVSKFTRVVRSKFIGSRSIGIFTKHVCGRTRELVHLIKSIVQVSHLSRNKLPCR